MVIEDLIGEVDKKVEAVVNCEGEKSGGLVVK